MRADDRHRIDVRLDKVLADRGMTLTGLADRVGVTIVNLSGLKGQPGQGRPVLDADRHCGELACQPGDVLGYDPD